MPNKASHLDGYNKGFFGTSGNSSELTQLDAGDVIFTSFGAIGAGAGQNDPWTKTYVNGAQFAPVAVATPAAPTGWGAVGYGLVDGVPTWVALTNSTTSTGGIMISNDGKTWTAKNLPSSPGGAWVSITFGHGLFVAVAATNATTTGIATSPDGVNWTFRTTTAPGGNWQSVTYGFVGTQSLFMAVAATTSTTAGIATSPDGITWTFQTSTAPGGNWSSVTYGAPGGTGTFVLTALGVSTTASIAKSTNGTSFTFATITAPLTTGLVASAYGSNQGLFVAVAANVGTTAGVFYYSADGATWVNSAIGTAPAQAWNALAYGLGTFYALSGGTGPVQTLALSTDGINWTYKIIPTGAAAYKAIACGDNKSGLVVMVANSTSTSAAAAYSLIGPSLLVEFSGGIAAEGQPDLYLTSNQQGYATDVTRFY